MMSFMDAPLPAQSAGVLAVVVLKTTAIGFVDKLLFFS